MPGLSQVELLRSLPSIDEVLRLPALEPLVAREGRPAVTDAIRAVLARLRQEIASGRLDDQMLALALTGLPDAIERELRQALRYSLQPIINATGVILHTNLGRAPLPRAALEHIGEIAAAYCNLEFDLQSGERGKRDIHVDRLFRKLFEGVSAAPSTPDASLSQKALASASHQLSPDISTIVVNNNAAAVLLALNSLAENGEVIVSRGELVEIGGSFRIPDVMAKSHATLREVGTTNRTRVADYEGGISERTRVLLRVHPSNFRMIGFTERPDLSELADLAHRYRLVMMEDLGSGCLVDLASCGVRDELPVGMSLQAGADVVTFSGDKLMGGPQAGILVGSREPLERIRRNALFRALRVDKLTIAALEATVSLYLQGRLDAIPVLRMMRLSREEIASRAQNLADRISELPGFTSNVRCGESVIGGGSTPGQTLPTWLVGVQHAQFSAAKLEEQLRHQRPAILGRVEKDELVVDLRTVREDQDVVIAHGLGQVACSR